MTKQTEIHKEINILIGTRIKSSRLNAGLSQMQLGKEIGVSSQQVNKYECAKDSISANKLWKIATVTGKYIGLFYCDSDIDMDGGEVNKGTLSIYRGLSKMNDKQRKALINLMKTIGKE